MNIVPNDQFVVSKPRQAGNLTALLEAMNVGDVVTLSPYARSIRSRASELAKKGLHYSVQLATGPNGETGARVTRWK